MRHALQNQSFRKLRDWLYPGLSGEADAPRYVSADLAAVIDIEHWVPCPQYMARVNVPLPPVGHTAVAIFDNVRNVASLAPNTFFCTNIMVRAVGLLPSSVTSRLNGGGNSALTSGFSAAQTEMSAMVGDSPQMAVGRGSILVVGASPTQLSPTEWNHMPMLAPGNGLQIRAPAINLAFGVDFMWVERRPEGDVLP